MTQITTFSFHVEYDLSYQSTVVKNVKLSMEMMMLLKYIKYEMYVVTNRSLNREIERVHE